MSQVSSSISSKPRFQLSFWKPRDSLRDIRVTAVGDLKIGGYENADAVVLALKTFLKEIMTGSFEAEELYERRQFPVLHFCLSSVDWFGGRQAALWVDVSMARQKICVLRLSLDGPDEEEALTRARIWIAGCHLEARFWLPVLVDDAGEFLDKKIGWR